MIHCGESNNRIYLMSLDILDLPFIIPQLEGLANEKGYTKIIAKIPSYAKENFLNSGYEEEATIPYLYQGIVAGHFMCKYLEDSRRIDPFKQHCDQVIEMAMRKKMIKETEPLEQHLYFGRAKASDVDEMALVYQEVFKTYPFPIFDKHYLLQTMKQNIIYFGIWDKKKLIALSSIEVAEKYSNAEVTDFATIEAYRGKGCASYLLSEMEKAMHTLGLHTAYTIARAKSYGMNSTFSKKGYTYSGTLPNNTNIAGQIESMNVWHKSLN